MLEARTYSIGELQKLSRFDRRTIVYYMQQGLLPKAGRRGPRTRHPDLCLQRLLFIRGLKDMQDQGRCGTITLGEIRRMLHALNPEALRGLFDRGLPRAEIEQLLKPPPPPEAAPTAASAELDTATAGPAVPTARVVGDGRSYGLADAGIRQRQATPVPSRPPSAAPSPAVADQAGAQPSLVVAVPPVVIPESLGEILRELEVRPSLTGQRLPPGASEQWTEIPITSRVFLSVRGLSTDDAPLANAAARALKALLRTR